ncbi:leucine dehydrogenase [Tistlia consotensis]|uniref:Leucine dehydrogenase n=1 Tax=Tistlia consotensis USBA 355 TaxID=560819 RepID=A0A1Y6BP73_9PROT|nr:Glu/Leu/Phe/Val dehydrogenase dimerization domain-containing protein [Tistlia consotensis]SMF13028.1 leucine dehydrogenase [Tistlia consotensis USBA 355]SNR50762.1 leucine dehydrogenase [Tistlia consotensis]
MIFESAAFDGHEQVVFASDRDSGLRAVIAVHDTTLGPALGGCRLRAYAGEAEAVTDVLRLARGMTCKAALAGVPFGGGKMVVLAEPAAKTPALLRAVGRAIDRLGGRYITGEDVGTTVEDMAEIGAETRWVMGRPESAGGGGDPSPSTALGCFVGIEAAVRRALGRNSLAGVRVAVQGLGAVGFRLCRLLHEAGAALVVSDVDPERVARCRDALGAVTVEPEAILEQEAEVLAPCALGAVVDGATAERLRVRIVAGAANNQLASPEDGRILARRGILYAPDYVINAGGMIRLSGELTGDDAAASERKVRAIAGTLEQLFGLAEAEGLAPSDAADRLACERISAAAARGTRGR